MNNYNFILVLGKIKENLENLEDLLFEKGCNDATLSCHSGIYYLEFDREANTFGEAVTSAIFQVESIDKNLKVTRVEPDDLVTISEIAARLNQSTEYVNLLREGKIGEGDFPVPISGFSHTLLWSWTKITQWLEKQGLIETELCQIAQYIADINYALFYRQDSTAKERLNKVNQQLSLV